MLHLRYEKPHGFLGDSNLVKKTSFSGEPFVQNFGGM